MVGGSPERVGQIINIMGWVNRRRDHGKLVFIDLRDRTGIVQLVISEPLSQTGVVGKLRPEFVLAVEGVVVERSAQNVNPNLPTGKVEVKAEKVAILAKSESLPFDMSQTELNLELPTLLDHRCLTLRHPKVRRIFEVQSAVLAGFRKTAVALGCREIVVPTIAASSTEGGAEVFKINYYNHSAFLTQSPQLYKQMLVPVFERVFTITKAYRAEPSLTTRHLAEVTQLDCEFGFVDFNALLDLLETTVSGMLDEATVSSGLSYKRDRIPRLTLARAQEIIFEETGRDVRQEKDLAPQDEVDICRWAEKSYQSDLVTITHFPTKKRAFYTMPDPANPEVSLSYDILFRGLEIASGSQRINDYGALVSAIKERGLDPQNFTLYLQAFKYGMPPEGGFSFGLERITMQLLELTNVREASLFPRDMERVDFRLSASRTKQD